MYRNDLIFSYIDHSLGIHNLALPFRKWINRLTSSVFDFSFPFCRSKKSALASLKSGHRKVALRHARELKLATESREKCTSLLNRVEEVLNTIADSESTKMVLQTLRNPIGRTYHVWVYVIVSIVDFRNIDVCLAGLRSNQNWS